MSKSEMSFIPCGIEVSARTLLVTLGEGVGREFANTPADHQAVLRYLTRAGRRARGVSQRVVLRWQHQRGQGRAPALTQYAG